MNTDCYNGCAFRRGEILHLGTALEDYALVFDPLELAEQLDEDYRLLEPRYVLEVAILRIDLELLDKNLGVRFGVVGYVEVVGLGDGVGTWGAGCLVGTG